MNWRMVLSISLIVFLLIGALYLSYVIQEQEGQSDSSNVSPAPSKVSTFQSNDSLSSEQSEMPLVNRVSLYLVAIGDDGQQGQQIGCGDSLVAISRPVESTRTPLRAAYNELFNLSQSDITEAGIINSLQDSNLKFDSAQVEDGVATIYLRGQLRLGGVCDGPRVQGQLEQIALQFPTIREVKIYIDDLSLEDILSLSGE